MIGIVKTVESKLHKTDVDVETIKTKNDRIDHIQFSIIEKTRKGIHVVDSHREELEMNFIENKITFCSTFFFILSLIEILNLNR